MNKLLLVVIGLLSLISCSKPMYHTDSGVTVSRVPGWTVTIGNVDSDSKLYDNVIFTMHNVCTANVQFMIGVKVDPFGLISGQVMGLLEHNLITPDDLDDMIINDKDKMFFPNSYDFEFHNKNHVYYGISTVVLTKTDRLMMMEYQTDLASCVNDVHDLLAHTKIE